MDTLIPNDQPAPDFTLADIHGRPHTLSNLTGKVVILNFWSAECPHSARADRELTKCLVAWGDDVVLLAIASNASETPAQIDQVAAERHLTTVLLDPDHRTADLYAAQTTPHLFVIDPVGILRYQGALDDVTFRKREPSQNYLCDAVAAVLAGRQPTPDLTPAYGCIIVRYKP
jgi:peroxiredoxin